MLLHAYRLKNYRRLRDVLIELDKDISIFVGANNSGKTSAAQGLHVLVSGNKSRFSLFDFSAPLWKEIDEIGEQALDNPEEKRELPSISLDLWFQVGPQDLVSAMPLLPSTEWAGSFVGMRVSFEPHKPLELVQNFRALREKANAAAAESGVDGEDYKPWPQTLSKYLARELGEAYEFRYYVLDELQFDNFVEKAGYEPRLLSGEPSGPALLRSLMRVDFLRAQRHLDDPSGEGSSRAEDLSKKLSKFYKRNLAKRAEDHTVLRALFASEKGLDDHLSKVFEDTLQRLEHLGYPGVANPKIVIRAALDPSSVLNQDARVHYVLGGEHGAQLPDSYNGLGFKNLIYMVVELIDLHERWKEGKVERAPLHMVFIEEPEAHLHAQIQQVFIRNVLSLLKNQEEDDVGFATQLLVTTHSPHILYERGFSPIRYFRRLQTEQEHSTEVVNLSRFKASEDGKKEREFLQRYLKLTHCDLFFADSALLVEGNVERLLMPAMIQQCAPRLRSSAMTILEVGGAFAHRFKDLVEFIGITTLVITDIDSVVVKDGDAQEADADDDEAKFFEVPNEEAAANDAEEQDGNAPKKKGKSGSTCPVGAPGAVTANQTLISWIPKKQTIAELLATDDAGKVVELAGSNRALARVAYQVAIPVTVGDATEQLCGRTLEEAFGLENADWCQQPERQSVGLRLKPAATNPNELAQRLHRRVTGKHFDKTKFALEVLASGPEANWKVPRYIAEGLKWLEDEVALEEQMEAAVAVASAEIAVQEVAPQGGEEEVK
ncbi:ATP-dependent endonuclease [Burkholderia ubonensis]|uniref:ATP-dependent nuclease n=1 Tax=Burkholderia ubonensis TaxID=101571 RepID=UPI00075EE1DE|nr:ATP-dependent endonuclease [Burkholderia ubonensis]KVT96550.1 ATP-dependent endonuclease [Burkholderia ubonensis]